MLSVNKFIPLACLALAACGHSPDRVVVTETRVVSKASKPAIPGVTSEQRFGRATMGGDSGETASTSPVEWDQPEGWVPIAATQFRTANFSVGAESECYLTLLPGDAGGVVANVNRWRSQMGLAPTTGAELEAGPMLELLGGPAPFVILEGEFSGMGGTPQPDWMLYGALFGAPGGTLFIKMVGPASEVRAEREKFVQFCASVRPIGQSTPPPSAATSAGPSGSGLAWTAPGSWNEEPKRSMREVSYKIGSAGEAECYVSILGGGAGGVAANINRWRGQVGLESLSPQEIDQLPQLDMLGSKATLFEASGDFTGMGGGGAESGQAILGVICELESSVLFVKMVGPAELIAAERENFVAFCNSLRRG